MIKLRFIEDLKNDPNVVEVHKEEIATSFFNIINDKQLREATKSILCIKKSGTFEGRAILLSNMYNWVLGENEGGGIILVPLLKKL